MRLLIDECVDERLRAPAEVTALDLIRRGEVVRVSQMQ